MEKFFHPDEAVTAAIRSVFERFAEFGSARRVWLWLRSEAPLFPLQDGPHGQIRWAVKPRCRGMALLKRWRWRYFTWLAMPAHSSTAR